MRGKYWTHEEVDFLKKNYKKIRINELSKKFNRSIKAIEVKASILGLGCSVVNEISYKKICLSCGKEFVTQVGQKRYCSKECAYKQDKINKNDYYQRNKEKRIKKHLEEMKRHEHYKEQIKNIKSKKTISLESIKMFFELECLSVNAYSGIKKIKDFTQREDEDAEKIYRLLRKEFIEGSQF